VRRKPANRIRQDIDPNQCKLVAQDVPEPTRCDESKYTSAGDSTRSEEHGIEVELSADVTPELHSSVADEEMSDPGQRSPGLGIDADRVLHERDWVLNGTDETTGAPTTPGETASFQRIRVQESQEATEQDAEWVSEPRTRPTVTRITPTHYRPEPLLAVLPTELRFLALYAEVVLREATKLGIMSDERRWSLAELRAWDGIGRFLYRRMQAASFAWDDLKHWRGGAASYVITAHEAVGLAMLSHCAWVGRAQSDPGEIWSSVWDSLGSPARRAWFPAGRRRSAECARGHSNGVSSIRLTTRV
jgi:hypothetical protein